MRFALLFIFFSFSVNDGFSQALAGGRKPAVPIIEYKNTSEGGHCNKIKILFKTPGADTVKISIREDSAGNPGKWYTNTSNPRAKDGDYSGLKENIDYDFQVEAINQYGKSLSPVLTRKKCQ